MKNFTLFSIYPTDYIQKKNQIHSANFWTNYLPKKPNVLLHLILLFFCLPFLQHTSAQIPCEDLEVTTYAGSGMDGLLNGPAQTAQFEFPNDVAVDNQGNVYVADRVSNYIRKIDPTGYVTIAAQGGPSTELHSPSGVAVDDDGNIYIADWGNHRIRKVNAGTSELITIAGGMAHPRGVDVDGHGNVYVANWGHHNVKKIDPFGNVTILASDIYLASDVAVDAAGNVYVTSWGSSSGGVYKINLSGTVTELGYGFKHPSGITVDGEGNVYVSDYGHRRIKKISTTGLVTTVAGTGIQSFADGPATTAGFNDPNGLEIDAEGNIYIADSGNFRVRKIGCTSCNIMDITATNLSDCNPPGGGVSTFTADLTVTFENPPTIGLLNLTGDAEASVSVSVLSNSTSYTFSGVTMNADGTPINITASFSTQANTCELTKNAGQAPIACPCDGGGVTTYAGTGVSGLENGPADMAQFDGPTDVATDQFGNVFVVDGNNHLIRKIDASGNVSILAGTGVPGFMDGPGAVAQFDTPRGIDADRWGNVWVADWNNHRIRRIIAATGEVSTFTGNGSVGHADRPREDATYNHPYGVAIDDVLGNMYIADRYNNRIRKIDALGNVSTIAGDGSAAFADGQGTASKTWNPMNVVADGNGNVYFTDGSNNRIRKIDASGYVSTFAGSGVSGFEDGSATEARFSFPIGITIDANGKIVIGDYFNNRIRLIDPDGTVSTLTGLGGPGRFIDGSLETAAFYSPQGVDVNIFGRIIVADQDNHRIRSISKCLKCNVLSISMTNVSDCMAQGVNSIYTADVTVAFSHPPTSGTLVLSGDAREEIEVSSLASSTAHTFYGVEFNAHGDLIKLTASFSANSSCSINTTSSSAYLGMAKPPCPCNVEVSTIANDFGIGFYSDIKIDSDGNFFMPNANFSSILKVTPSGVLSTFAGNFTNDILFVPRGIDLDENGVIYVADYGSSRILKIESFQNIKVVAGSGLSGYQDGSAATARFNHPRGVAVDKDGNVYVADGDNHRIRKIDTNGMVTTIAGDGIAGYQDGPGLSAQFHSPHGIDLDEEGNIYVADFENHKIRKIDKAGNVTTLAGGEAGYKDGHGTSAQLKNPFRLEVDRFGNIYVAEMMNHLVRRIDPYGNVTTVAGSGKYGYQDGYGATASFSNLHGLALNDNDELFVLDYGYNDARIRKINCSDCQIEDISLANISACEDEELRSFYTADVTVTFSQTPATGSLNLSGDASASVDISEMDSPTTHTFTNMKMAADGIKISFTAAFSEPNTCLLTMDSLGTAPMPCPCDTEVTTIAGTGGYGSTDGAGTSAMFNGPYGIGRDDQGNIFIADRSNHKIRKIDVDGNVSTIAGTGEPGFNDGPGESAQFNEPMDVVVDAAGNLYITDFLNNRIRKIDTSGEVSTFSGGLQGSTNGPRETAKFHKPHGIIIDELGNLYIADFSNNKIRKIDTDGIVSTVAGTFRGDWDGPLTFARFKNPSSLAFDLDGNILVADENHRIRKVDLVNRRLTTISGSWPGYQDASGIFVQFDQPRGLAVDAFGNIYIADAGNNRIRIMDKKGKVLTFAGSLDGHADGSIADALFDTPTDIEIDEMGNLYVVDSKNNRIRKIACVDMPQVVVPRADNSTTQTTGTLDLKMNPNPANDMVDLRFAGIGTNSILIIHDQLGRQLTQMDLEEGQTRLHLELENAVFGNGIFYVSIISATEKLTKRLVIAR